jgi:hypothetical protein
MVEAIAEAVMSSAPETDPAALSSAMSSALKMPDGALDYIFSEFFQFSASFPNVGGGTGGPPIYGR